MQSIETSTERLDIDDIAFLGVISILRIPCRWSRPNQSLASDLSLGLKGLLLSRDLVCWEKFSLSRLHWSVKPYDKGILRISTGFTSLSSLAMVTPFTSASWRSMTLLGTNDCSEDCGSGETDQKPYVAARKVHRFHGNRVRARAIDDPCLSQRIRINWGTCMLKLPFLNLAPSNGNSNPW